MANQIQKVMYEGYLADNPELKFTPQGKAVCNFRIGSNRSYKNAKGEVVKETTWLKITAWNKLAEIVGQYCEKGSHVIVSGILRVGPNGSPLVYTLKSGEPAASYEVTANEVRILKGKEGVATDAVEAEVEAVDDVPF